MFNVLVSLSPLRQPTRDLNIVSLLATSATQAASSYKGIQAFTLETQKKVPLVTDFFGAPESHFTLACLRGRGDFGVHIGRYLR